jgi:hypothetical protein
MKLLVSISISITFVCLYGLGVWISGIELERGSSGVYLFVGLLFTVLIGMAFPVKEIVTNYKKEN